MYLRHITSRLLEALADTPVVFLNGARQTGKSTLIKQISEEKWPATYFNLDNVTTLAAAQSDPLGFIHKNNKESMIIDEIQRAPELLLPIKEAVDNDRKPGRFLLTGSANILLLPKLSESLAGRMEILTLWPLSQGEIKDIQESFIEKIFAKEFLLSQHRKAAYETKLEDIVLGGYPDVLSRPSHHRRYEWFNSYVTAILQRDVRELANIESLTVFPKLLSLLAARATSLLNYAELSRASGIPHTTLLRYMTLLQTTFLTCTVLPWHQNKSKRLVKSPKIYLCDTGLLVHLLNWDNARLLENPDSTGMILENFVMTELHKQLTWSNVIARLFHYRTQSGHEVDVVLEDTAGRCVGIEIKASTTVTNQDFKGLRAFADHVGARQFLRGVVLYRGDKLLSFGEELYALPISMLWARA